MTIGRSGPDVPPGDPARIVNTGVNYGAQGVFYAPVIIQKPPSLVPRWASAEDVERAEARLAETPCERAADPAPLPPRSRMQLVRNPLFVGRARLLQEMARVLRDPACPPATVVVAGMGGIGKSQLASEFVHRYGQYFGGVYWLRFAIPESVQSEFAECGRAPYLGLDARFDDLAIDQQVAFVREALRSPLPRLLVFDGCEDPSLLTQWRPSTGGARVLVTSRNPRWDPALGVTVLTPGVLPRAESLALLARFRPDLPLRDGTLDAIAATVGDLPLALHLAGSFLRSYRHSSLGDPRTYAAQLAARPLDHPSLSGEAGGVLPTAHDLDVARTFAVSRDQLDATEPADARAVELLERCAVFAPGEPVPRSVLLRSAGTGADAAPSVLLFDERALARIVTLGLVDEEDDGALRMHPLVADSVRASTRSGAPREAVEATLVATVTELDATGDLVRGRALEAHLRAIAVEALPRMDELAGAVASVLGNHLRAAGALTEAEGQLRRALQIAETLHGKESREAAVTVNDYGYVLQHLGRHEQARACLERAACLFGAAGDVRNRAASLDNLGQLEHARGDDLAARRWFEDALAARETIGADHPELAITLHNLGTVLAEGGELESARMHLERALAIQSHRLGAVHHATAATHAALGSLLLRERRPEDARVHLAHALEIQERLVGPDHPRVLGALAAAAMVAAADVRAAEPFLARASARLDAAAGGVPSAYLNDLGWAFWVAGRYDRALACYERAWRAEAATGGDGMTVLLLNNAGRALADQGRLDEAREAFARAITEHDRRGGGEDFLARLLTNSGRVFTLRGEIELARTQLERAEEIRRRRGGSGGTELAVTLRELALVRIAEMRDADALTLLESALTIHERTCGESSPEAARDRYELGALFARQRRAREAAAELARARAIQEHALGLVHPLLADTLLALAEAALIDGSASAARELAARAAAIYAPQVVTGEPRLTRARALASGDAA